MEQYAQLFAGVFAQNLEKISRQLDQINPDQFASEQFAGIRIVFHNMKSSAAMMNYNSLSYLSKLSEMYIEKIMEKQTIHTGDIGLIRAVHAEMLRFYHAIGKKADGMEIAYDVIERLEKVLRNYQETL
jgi:chemotaxis protein histidine kinase CheA